MRSFEACQTAIKQVHIFDKMSRKLIALDMEIPNLPKRLSAFGLYCYFISQTSDLATKQLISIVFSVYILSQTFTDWAGKNK